MFGLYNVIGLPVVVFVQDYVTFGVLGVGLPLNDIVFVEYKSLGIESAIPFGGHRGRQSDAVLSLCSNSVVDQVIEYGTVIQDYHVFIIRELQLQEVDGLCAVGFWIQCEQVVLTLHYEIAYIKGQAILIQQDIFWRVGHNAIHCGSWTESNQLCG